MSNIRILPILGGGGGDTPTGTIQITENGTYNVAQYASAEVNVSGSSDPVIISLAVARVTGVKVSLTVGVATLSSYNKNAGNYIYWDTDPLFSNKRIVSITGPTEGHTTNIDVAGLPENTLVYFAAGITVGGTLYASSVVSATTLDSPVTIKWYDNGVMKHTKVANWDSVNNSKVVGISFETSDCRATIATESLLAQDESTGEMEAPVWGDNTQIVSGTGTAASSSIANQDFSGKQSAEALLAVATYQPNWRTDATIFNSYAAGAFPAACLCWRYSTIGTSQGDWYLPSAGQVATVMNLKTEINAALAAVGKSDMTAYLWSTTQHSTNVSKAYCSSNGTGTYSDNKQYMGNSVMPFSEW